MNYDDFRTGLTYHDVYMMLWDRKYKRRHTVLGKWHQIKLEMWDEYQRSQEVPF
jgi:hypothetical protein